MVVFGVLILTILLRLSAGQDANCDYTQDAEPGQTYYINYTYPRNTQKQCQWIGHCPSGYRCRLDCPQINLPTSSGCSVDRLLISRSGDPQLNNADVYCGREATLTLSTGKRISVGLITSSRTTGGHFSCQLRAEAESPTPETCSCGYKKSNRIIGGQETGVNEFPMMAGVVYADQKEIKCGGTIIDKRYVVTAAYCVEQQPTSNLVVVVGKHDSSTGGNSTATSRHRVDRVKIHPKYNGSNHDYDIAILRVSQDMAFSDRVGPVCLPFKFTDDDFTGRTFTLLGWGSEKIGGPKSKTLRKVDVSVISQSSCHRKVSSLTPRQFCTYTKGKGACQDDAGGPVLFTDPSTNLQFLVGIISYSRLCAERDEPGINTRVPVLLGWIENNTPGADFCDK